MQILTIPATSQVKITTEKISSSWKFKLNQLDFELGRRYWLSKCFTMRPFVGIRAAWTDTEFKIISTHAEKNLTVGTDLGPFSANHFDRFENDFSGGGLLAGIQPNWYWTPCFSLFGNMDISLLWGEFKRKKRELYSGGTPESDTVETIDYLSGSRSSYSNMLPILDLAIGLRYENTYCDCQYRFSLDLGWEHHIFFHLNQRYKLGTLGQGLTEDFVYFQSDSYNETLHDVSFGGFVLRARFDF